MSGSEDDRTSGYASYSSSGDSDSSSEEEPRHREKSRSKKRQRSRSPTPIKHKNSKKKKQEAPVKKRPPAKKSKQQDGSKKVEKEKRTYKPRLYGHCNRCKQQVLVKNGQKITLKNGAAQIRGTCKDCGGGVNSYPKTKNQKGKK